jgi:DNA repair protein RadC
VSDGHGGDPRPPGYRLMLREMAADERPREKLKLRGSAVLSDGELLAIILNTGIVGEIVAGVQQRSLAQQLGPCGLLREAQRRANRSQTTIDGSQVRPSSARWTAP